MQVVREHYLREDIACGSFKCEKCDREVAKLEREAEEYVVIDTNVALQSIDFLENEAVDNVIVPSTVLQETKKNNLSIYNRLRNLCAAKERKFYVFSNENHRDTYVTAAEGESPNDRNDRAIRVTALWYMKEVPGIRILLLTNDAENRRRAKSEGILAASTREYAEARKATNPMLVDLVVASSVGESNMKVDADGGRNSKRQRIYEEHKPMSEITVGLKQGRLHQGTLRVNMYNPFEGYVSSESMEEEILIGGRANMNRAFDGDVVAVELLPEQEWRVPSRNLPSSLAVNGEDRSVAEEEHDEGGVVEELGAGVAQINPGEDYGGAPITTDSSGRHPCGRVVGIIKRNWRTRGYCGSLRPIAKEKLQMGMINCLFVPVERKFPIIRIATRQAAQLMDQRILVSIDAWEVDSLYPSGHYVRALGPIGDKDTETEVLIIENDINTAPFSVEVHACVPALPWSVSNDDLSDPNRQDLRHLSICSVDPPGCKDIDDALHCRKLDNGNLEIGVHIADVTHFLKPSTAMDEEAALRSTTVYLVQRRIDMLPKPLTEDICSLRAGVDRLAFSVLWEMTPHADIVKFDVTKSIISSKAALTYAEAQSRIDDRRLHDEVTESLREMNRIAKTLRQRRADAGALSLASPEVKFELDTETHDPLDVGMYQVRETNQMVEEMMLLANITVAKQIEAAFPSCAVLRRHPTPTPKMFESLIKACNAVGISLDPSTSKTLAISLDAAVKPDDAFFNKMVRIMATRCLTQAVYFRSGDVSKEEYRHYGLATPIYTHFTSPIRRYADVLVHRLLMAAIGLRILPDNMTDRSRMKAIVDNMNYRHRNAQMAGRASVGLHTLIFFKDRPTIADARIIRVRTNGLIVFVPKFGIEGPVYFHSHSEEKGGDAKVRFALDDHTQVARSLDGNLRFQVFDTVTVSIRVEESQGHRRKLVLALCQDENKTSQPMTMG